MGIYVARVLGQCSGWWLGVRVLVRDICSKGSGLELRLELRLELGGGHRLRPGLRPWVMAKNRDRARVMARVMARVTAVGYGQGPSW